MSNFKLLFLDIETSPAVTYVWGLFNQNISVDQIITPTSVLCWGAKWAGEKDVIYSSANGELDGRRFNKMILDIHKLLSEADAVCHFNGASFDIPRLNAEFVKLGLRPPPSIPQIDLKTVVQRRFATTSSKLAFIGPYLKIGEKVKNDGWSLWDGCLKGKKDSWAAMEKYNRQDVVLLEKLYTRVLPWIENHPNMNLYVATGGEGCTNCGSTKLRSYGLRRAETYTYRRFQCLDCGAWNRSRVAIKPADPLKIRS